MKRPGWRLPKVRVTRERVLFLSGMVGIFYETVFQQTDRPTLLVLFSAMIGLPAFLQADSAGRKDSKAETPPEDKPRKRISAKRKVGDEDGFLLVMGRHPLTTIYLSGMAMLASAADSIDYASLVAILMIVLVAAALLRRHHIGKERDYE